MDQGSDDRGLPAATLYIYTGFHTSHTIHTSHTWWWLPLPLLMISTPESARSMCGARGVKSSSQVSAEDKCVYGGVDVFS
jgi:hypothetical protein